MAPQLGMGTFRIDQNGMADAYAMSNGNNREYWALRHSTFVRPSYPAPAASMDVMPILPAPSTVNLAALCAFLTGIGEDPAHFEIREHKIATKSCP